MIIVNKLGLSFYNRDGLDELLEKYFQDLDFNDILSKELLITSYEYNSKSPRFFSRAFKAIEPIYDVLLKEAVGGSSSAPLYFDPLKMENTVFNITYNLIDGGIICNNPSLYAYIIA